MFFKEYNGIRVFYEPELDGGGSSFGQMYIPYLKSKQIKVKTVCEICAGPAFIGFSILSEGLCDKLVLLEYNPKAIDCIKNTIRKNGLENTVTAYQSDGLKDIPEREKWDLVVGNPPHYYGTPLSWRQDIKSYDPFWTIHKEFYQNISKHLTEHGQIILQENYYGSEPEKSFGEMIRLNGLRIVGVDEMQPVFQKPVSKLGKLRKMFDEGRVPINPLRWFSTASKASKLLDDNHVPELYFLKVEKKPLSL
ncbi:methyltransferase [Candidatus Micrarchaeota archaeon]|nr:methyltransferase [Candidatus Micrarchaeota archaeon]